jgi:heme-degrading monooxygenase HmoA
MFIAMNRFRVVKGSEDAFENLWLSRDSHLDTVPGLWNSAYSKVRRPKITHCMPPTPYGRAGPRSRPGPDPRPFVPLTVGPDRTSPFYLGHPQFEGFEVRQTIGARKKANVAA